MATRPKKPETDEADPRETADHPRLQERLIGHHAAERTFLDAWVSGRLHHAWMIAGPKGIGKATFAFRIAKFLLAHPVPGATRPADLSVSPDETAVHLVHARSHPDLFVLQRAFDTAKEKLKQDISVDDVRLVTEFFSKTSAFEGWRVVIVDAVDDLNNASANALLKILEEPPKRALFLLVAHAPGQALRTIRSRCRMLPMRAPEGLEDQFGRDRELRGTEAESALSEVEKAVAAGRPLTFDAAGKLAERVGGFGRDKDFELFSFGLVKFLRGEARRRALQRHPSAIHWNRAAIEAARTLKTGDDLNIDKRLTVLNALAQVIDTQQKT
ncbi:MAG: DNA polymerase III subunit delta' [Hyphomicrobiales bacterium]